MNTMLLRQLRFRDPQRLVMVWEANPALDSLVAERMQTSLQNFTEWREQNHVFDGMAFFRYSTFDLAAGEGKPEQLKAAPVSPGFFDVLGIQGILGRAFTDQESGPGKDHAVMLSDSLFQRRVGGNPKILGQILTMNGVGYTIVGVLPRHFRLPSFRGGMEQFHPEVWVPADIDPKRRESDLLERRLYTFARLKPATSIDSARAEMTLISKRLEEKYPQSDRTWHSSVFPLADEDIGAGMRRTLFSWCLNVQLHSCC
jgi:putative ABC transport system permease protein